MARKVLVSLISEQTIPNVELIKEFKNQIDKFIFIDTDRMKERSEWIKNAVGIDFESITVNPYDVEDIEEKLKNYDFGDDEIIVNITGGTKLMTIVASEFFKDINATIYYVTGHNKEYIKVIPKRGKRRFRLQEKLYLREYLEAYGFTINKISEPYHNFEMAKKLYDYFMYEYNPEDRSIFENFRIHRNKKLDLSEYPELEDFLINVNYPYNDKILTKYDNKYLSGEWLEEYIYFKLKQEMNFDDNEIFLGVQIEKKGVPNEFDVMFIYENKLYIIECKTFITSIEQTNGKIKEKRLIGEIIYKADALRNKFGLFANTTILTVDEIKDQQGKPLPGYEKHFERAEISRINLISKRDLLNNRNFKNLLKL